MDGERLLVRGLPRCGKTLLSKAVADYLGETAFYVDGGTMTEENQAEQHDRIHDGVATRVKRHNCAQLVFDGYGHAIRKSRGGILHSRLYGQLVDGAHSRDIGAIFTSRYADALDSRVSGSPLLGRVTVIELPTLSEQDAARLGLSLKEARSFFGDSTALARLAWNAEPMGCRDGISDFVSLNASSIGRDLPPGAVQVLVGAQDLPSVDSTSRRALRSLGCDSDGGFRVARLIADSRLIDELTIKNGRWPSNKDASVGRFCGLLADLTAALWVDRYIFNYPRLLSSFLRSVRQSTAVPIRLLGNSNDYHVRPQITAELSNVPAVEARVMARRDFKSLHDRHLVDPAGGVGFVVPTADVILSRVQPGSAVAVSMPSIGFDYEACWRRGAKL